VFRLRSGLVDPQGAAGHFFSVKFTHRFSGLVVFGHFDESESSWLVGFPITHDVDARDLPERLEEGA
jgi:hypothetical protein